MIYNGRVACVFLYDFLFFDLLMLQLFTNFSFANMVVVIICAIYLLMFLSKTNLVSVSPFVASTFLI